MSGEQDTPKRLSRRLGWFLALWLAGVAVVTAVAYGLRLLIL